MAICRIGAGRMSFAAVAEATFPETVGTAGYSQVVYSSFDWLLLRNMGSF
jgi:hypothetical protein